MDRRTFLSTLSLVGVAPLVAWRPAPDITRATYAPWVASVDGPKLDNLRAAMRTMYDACTRGGGAAYRRAVREVVE